MNILAIGNSFSQDAARFLHGILSSAGIPSRVVNLYIGGCSLERHWRNIETGEAAYEYELNGERTLRMVSVKEALLEERWDVITLQQASHDSGWAESYEPFLGLIVNSIGEKRPEAGIMLHETWAYDPDSTHDCFMRYHRDTDEMYARLHQAYGEAVARYGLALLPCGSLIQRLRATGMFGPGKAYPITRDGFHMSLLYGRYALALLWAAVLCGIDPAKDTFIPRESGQEADGKALNVIRRTAAALLAGKKPE